MDEVYNSLLTEVSGAYGDKGFCESNVVVAINLNDMPSNIGLKLRYSHCMQYM